MFVAGSSGLVGSEMVKALSLSGYNNIIISRKNELDLINQLEVNNFFKVHKPDIVVLAAAKVGGINANSKLGAEFIYENIMIQSNIIHSAYKNNIKKLLFLGSACIYPKNAINPIKEKYLLNGTLEPTNEPYSIAKIAGIKMCENYFKQYGCNYISVMPNNLYGPNDNFDLRNSHVLPALLRKFHEAKLENKNSVEVWGSGKPLREFLHVSDMVNACIFLLENISAQDIYDKKISHINIGTGYEITINKLAELIRDVVGYNGEIKYNKSYPDGMERKLLDSKIINDLGWKPKVKLEEGIKNLYEWYLCKYK